jgi:hypothetical protein
VTHGKFHLWPCANYASLSTNVAENWNCPVMSDGNLPYRISTVSAKLFMGYMEMNIHGLM